MYKKFELRIMWNEKIGFRFSFNKKMFVASFFSLAIIRRMRERERERESEKERDRENKDIDPLFFFLYNIA